MDITITLILIFLIILCTLLIILILVMITNEIAWNNTLRKIKKQVDKNYENRKTTNND
jgi:hypothetical protein